MKLLWDLYIEHDNLKVYYLIRLDLCIILKTYIMYVCAQTLYK